MKHPEARSVSTSTPWGRADYAYTYARGIISYSTPGHGGFHLDATMNALIPETFRKADAWYEEDCESMIPLYFLANRLTEYCDANDRYEFMQSLRRWFPYEWEATIGEKVPAADSFIVRRDEFRLAHLDDYVVQGASGDWHELVPTGCVGVTAIRESDGDRRLFLVLATEYTARGEFGYVVDPDHLHRCPLDQPRDCLDYPLTSVVLMPTIDI